MHPLLVSIACAHGSLVTPKSTFVPSLPVCVVVEACDRQPEIANGTASVTASAATTHRRMVMECLAFRPLSIRERPRFPVVASPNPYSEQALRLEQEEPDDQQSVQDRLDLDDGDSTARRA